MIHKLRKRIIWITGSSLFAVFTVIFLVICIISTRQLNSAMDILTDRISDGGGVFMPFNKDDPPPSKVDRFPGFFTEETPFSTRFFLVHLDKSGNIVGENINSVSSVTKEDARRFASDAMSDDKTRGWQQHYRYKKVESPKGITLVFVDGSMNRSVTSSLLITSASVLAASFVVVLFFVIVLSRRAVSPMAESYEKQKQFVTDANHELKTPLTLILTNLDILESEIGKNEWLIDIREEAGRMKGLVSQLTALSRLDEDQPELNSSEFSLSDMAKDTVSEFAPLAQGRGLALSSSVQDEVFYTGDEGLLRRVMSILLDNAVKYCDPMGNISVVLSGKRRPVITVENAYSAVDNIELAKLFDRFYRSDKARTSSGSFGIGLSIAHSIVRQHRGEMAAYKAGEGRIGFKIILK